MDRSPPPGRPSPRRPRWGAWLLCLLPMAACGFQAKLPADATLSCSGGDECAATWVCVTDLSRCLPRTSACIVVEGNRANIAPDGSACDQGICVAGTCAPPRCGDGLRSSAEDCDDGNDDEGDACRNDCTLARCGDGVVHAGEEECDDGNDDNDDACLSTCIQNRCGDGFWNLADEECDDGNGSDQDPCLTTCEWNVCGDGFLNPGLEECDDGNNVDEDQCKNDCTRARCGDGVLFPALEECDDGNTVDDDACLNRCVRNVCGDGVLYANHEECDDGNADNQDGCLSLCLQNRCGDGFLHVGIESCDDGDARDDNACKNDCTRNICGDGVLYPGVETCDDGNTRSGDGCRGDCGKVEVCGDGLLDEGEACDDGNANELDRCIGCRVASWTPVVRVGLGEGEGDPAATPLGTAGLAVDAGGNLFLADIATMLLYRYDADAGKLTRYGGTGTPTDVGDASGVPATDVNFAGVVGLSVDGLGNLLVADLDEALIRRVDVRTREVTTLAGNGEQGFAGDGLPATLASLFLPEMAISDGSGNLFIADTENHRIRRVDARSGVITTVAGSGTPGFSGDGGDPLLASLFKPRDLDFDAAGNLYILDRSNGRVRRLEPDPEDRTRFHRITTVVGDNSAYDPAEEGLIRGIGTGGLQSIAVTPDGRFLYIIVREVTALLVADLEEETVEVFAGSLTESGARTDVPLHEARFTKLQHVALDGPDRIYLSEPDLGVIHVIERSAAGAPWWIRTIAGAAPDISTQSVFGYSAYFMHQIGTGYSISTGTDCQGQPDLLYLHAALPGSHRIIERTCTGAVRVIAGTGQPGFAGDGGNARAARFATPRGITAGEGRTLYVADHDNHRVRVVDDARRVHTLAGTGTPGDGGDGGPAAAATLRHPTDVAVDAQGGLIIVDSGNHRLRRISLASGVIETLAGTGEAAGGPDHNDPLATALSQPFGARYLPASWFSEDIEGGFVVFSERGSHRVRVLMDVRAALFPGQPPSTLRRLYTLAGTGEPGFADSENGKQAQFFHPRSLSLFAGEGCSDASGQMSLCLLLLDGYDRVRLLRLAAQNSLTEPLVASVTTIIGGTAPADDGDFEHAALRGPSSFLFIDESRLVVVERVTGRLRLIDLAARQVHTISGMPDGVDPGQADVPVAVARPLRDPASMVYDEQHTPPRLLVAERGHHTLREFSLHDPDAPATWTTRTFAGRSFATGHKDGPLSEARLLGPSGLALDAEARFLFVSEHGNQTLRRIDLSTETITTIAGLPGRLGSYGDGVAASTALLYRPSGLALGRGAGSGERSLYVADTGSHRVRRIDGLYSQTPIIRSVLGDGAAASSGEGGPARFFPVHAPTGLDVDEAGNVYATSLDAVRVVMSGDDGRAAGDDEVTSIYGAPPRIVFPEPITTCVQHVRVAPGGGSVFAIDQCQGLLLELVRELSP